MSEVSDLIFQATTPVFKKIIEDKSKEYETGHKIMKIYDSKSVLVGLCVYHDFDNIRFLDEAHYIGKNKYMALRMYKWVTNTKNKLSLTVQKANSRMYEFYKRMGFKVIDENAANFLLERGN